MEVPTMPNVQPPCDAEKATPVPNDPATTDPRVDRNLAALHGVEGLKADDLATIRRLVWLALEGHAWPKYTMDTVDANVAATYAHVVAP